MVFENNNNNRRNDERLQSPPSNIREIKKQIEKEMKDGIKNRIKKEVVNKKTLETIAKSKPVKDLKEEILKKAKEKKRQEVDTDFTESRREEILNDRIQTGGTVERQTERKKIDISGDAALIAQKSYIKTKIARRLTGEMAYRIAQKMTEEANRGGVNAIGMILVTLFMAIWIDLTDIIVLAIGPTVTILGIVSVAGIPIGAVVGAITIIGWIINFVLSLVIIFFWVNISGGAHKKWFWKIVIRLVVGVLFIDAVPYLGLLPLSTIMVCWNWSDFAKDKKRARKELNKFKAEFQRTGRISKKHAKDYV